MHVESLRYNNGLNAIMPKILTTKMI